ncbi:alpha/beta hydrolase [Nocardioides jiangxiensis]|uniref:Alpha/beta hydrolase n=1 Tax=Nocardioides jiangxiensis TaxID=3064524 RepID=A0ABT9B4G1_9ACTN|nr:alpha/beta hydrolase [Nocardioides sp. WY-20]MDO7869617.1 alpha/beta hydrolase [Nocardioides sp. WY-20]
MATNQPLADVLGDPYTAEVIDLPADDEGRVVATLVKLPAPAPTGRAVLHVHGFCDYFFQTSYAEWWTARGYDFYALDLRKYGRSLLPHQTPNFARDLADYFPELDEAWTRVTTRDGHDHVVLSAHSTGGLTVPLWVHERAVPAAGIVLNSPWFDLQGPAWQRTWGTSLIHRVGRLAPMAVMPRNVSGTYARSLHRDFDGEWDFDLSWKPADSFPVRFGWISAIRRGHARLHEGLDLAMPVLVLSSARSGTSAKVDETARSTDLVLDVEQIRKWAPSLGSDVTSVAVEGGLHDLSLSREDVRARFYDAIGDWLATHVDR